MPTNRLRIVVFTAGSLVPVNRVLYDRLAADPLLDLRGIVVDEHRPPVLVRLARRLQQEGWPWLWFTFVSTIQSWSRQTARWLYERFHAPTEPAVSYAQWARQTGIPVYRVADIAIEDSAALIHSLQADLGVIVGRHLFPRTVTAIPTHGTLSLRYSGAVVDADVPVGYREFLAGERSIDVAVQVALTDAGAGQVLAQTALPIDECDTLESLDIKAGLVGGRLYYETIRQFAVGQRSGIPLNDAPVRTSPVPGAFSVWRLERRLKRHAAKTMPVLRERLPWTVRARVFLQYVVLLPWLLYRRRALTGQHRAPLAIFFYHVVGNRPINHMCLPLEAFVRQIEFLRRYYNVLSLDQLVDRVRSGLNDRLAAAITFDDGYQANEWAIEYLRYHGVPAAFFVSIGHITDGTPFDHDRQRGFEGARPMVAPDVSRLATDGFLVGSHGVYHENFGTLDGATADRVLRESRERVERVCGRTPEYFSFPKGHRAVNITAESYALATRHYRGVFSAYGGHNFPSEGRQHFVRLPNPVGVLDLAITMDGYTGFRDCIAGNEWGVRSYALAPY